MTKRQLAAITAVAIVLLVASVLGFALAERPTDVAAETEVASAKVTPQPVLTPTPSPEPTVVPTVTPTPVEVEPAVLVTIPADLISTPTPSEPTSVPLPALTRIPAEPRDNSVVYLTFDDGPDPKYTNQLLDLLAQYNAKATFFVIGNSVDAYPATVARIAAEGHALGNHTYNHEALPLLGAEEVVATLSATNNAIARATGRSSRCVRPPYASLNQPTLDLLRQQGFAVSMWEVDSQDWRGGDSYTIASQVLRDTKLGHRILFHDGPANRAATVGAVAEVLKILSTRGVQFQALPTC